MGSSLDSFSCLSEIRVGDRRLHIFSLESFERAGYSSVARLPFSLRILLENLLRHEDNLFVPREDIESLARLGEQRSEPKEIAFMPARVLLQDFTGVPAIVDLAAMREAMRAMGGDPSKINPLQSAELVIDHSVQVDMSGTPGAFALNANLEFERNKERYAFLRWGQKAFRNFRVVPPDTGIVHQVNLEYLARVVCSEDHDGKLIAFPDTLVGTDSHTTMINGLGVVGWGVGGIEAEAAMLGQPLSMLIPEVVGFKLDGNLPPGATATDAVLTVTQMLRKKGVVGKFVEFFGPGLSALSLADRATIANMAPEYGATIGFFPVDSETLNYLRMSGRGEETIRLVEVYAKSQGLFRTDQTPGLQFSDTLELDLSSVEPSLAGPKRPQDRLPLKQSKILFRRDVSSLLQVIDKEPMPEAIGKWISEGGKAENAPPQLFQPDYLGPRGRSVSVTSNGNKFDLQHGSVVIAAITSCTNTSNPAVMIAAGLLAKKAVERGLKSKPWVKTSLAPGSKVVTTYLEAAGLLSYLEQLNFHLVGYGCTTCIGNSGPLSDSITQATKAGKLVVASVLSGNRNFEGRINPLVRANYLASPPLVVAYALVGRMDFDPYSEPIGEGSNGEPVYLRDIWPSQEEVRAAISQSINGEMFKTVYADVFKGDEHWQSLEIPEGDLFHWAPESTYVRHPPYFENMPGQPQPIRDIDGARVLAMLGDSVTTDHISPAGSIPADSPAGRYLIAHGISPKDFNSFGARRGNHEVMVRGTFGNIRLRNLLVPGTEGGWTVHLPEEENVPIFDAATKYQEENIPLLVIAGKEYGTGSSRDWAAKGTALLGVKAVLAESFERIHRSNLIGMGILPLQFKPGENRETLGLTGREKYSISGIATGLKPCKELTVTVSPDGSSARSFSVIARIDTPVEVTYYQHGGILQYVLRQLL